MSWLSRASVQPIVTSNQVLTDAFMAMDAAQSKAETAVNNYRSISGNTDLDGAWDAVRTKCYEAAAHYLTLTAEGAPTITLEALEYGTGLLESAARQVEDFQTDYNTQLNTGVAALAELTASVQYAQSTAQQARVNLSHLDATLASYPSVRDAAQLLSDTTIRLGDLWAARDYANVKTATQDLVSAAAELDAAMRAAPGLAYDAKNALSSISTRIAGARTRLEGVAPALSALLKEFAAASSADLFDNESKARQFIDEAADYLGRARAAQTGAPEEALMLVQRIRAALRCADELIDAVPSRLRMLHELRDNPETRCNKTRFALHDAQMFAVNHNLTDKWGSILDSQLQRIERLNNGLDALHPDYWAYNNGLNEVENFIQSVVEKMRAQISGPQR